MREVDTVPDLLAVLREIGAKHIGVDGIDGAGKSYLAKELARALNMPHLDLDSFLERNQGGFVEHIKYEQLVVTAPGGAFVISGVCLLEVLARAGISIDALVYVKRFRQGLWADEVELDISEPLEEFLAREREAAALVTKEPVEDLGLSEEIIRYHYHRRPYDRANVVYRRNDG